MNENKHTPEPWSVDPDSTDYYASILDADGGDTILLGDYVNWWMTKANARRIVACVNACAGIDTELLETAPVGFFNSTYGHPKYLEEITKQRDELLAALERFATWARGQHRAQSKGCHATFDMMMLRDEIDFAEAAIASVKELK